MGILDLVFRTINCNACEKNITYDRAKEKETFDAPDNVWMKSFRQVTTLDSRVLGYCSDVCEVKGAGTGQHNLPEQKKIISEPASAVAVAAAAAAAERARLTNEALHQGAGQISLS
jgi:threonine synthase